jgi:hypothetical protein
MRHGDLNFAFEKQGITIQTNALIAGLWIVEKINDMLNEKLRGRGGVVCDGKRSVNILMMRYCGQS